MQVRDPAALRRWRQLRALSQRDLAYLCRCSQAAISLLERGGMTSLSDELALNLSARLQVPWEELFTTDAPAAAVERPRESIRPAATAAADQLAEGVAGGAGGAGGGTSPDSAAPRT
jgi:transcriptional regulator with XRE-family HTH domain